METKVSEGDFKGHPVISMEQETEGGFPLRLNLGVKKAKLVVENFEVIKAFVEKNEKELF